MEHDVEHVKRNMTLTERQCDIRVRRINGMRSKLQKYT